MRRWDSEEVGQFEEPEEVGQFEGLSKRRYVDQPQERGQIYPKEDIPAIEGEPRSLIQKYEVGLILRNHYYSCNLSK